MVLCRAPCGSSLNFAGRDSSSVLNGRAFDSRDYKSGLLKLVFSRWARPYDCGDRAA